MSTITDLGDDVTAANTIAASICAALNGLREAEFTRFSDTELLQFAPLVERVARLVFSVRSGFPASERPTSC